MMLSSALLLVTLVACAGGGSSSSSSSSNRIDPIAASCILTDARISSPTSDDDGDGLLNSIDVDDDGDGLIEIATAEQFNQIRYNLLGSNFMLSQVGVGNANGCGNRKDITACNGYELSADISLADYNNWEPIGSCSTNSCANKNTFFKAVFDGNGHIIKDLNITNTVAPYTNAAGLFGAIDSTAQLRNVNICFSSITGAGNNVGMLVGYANGASVTSSYAASVNISGVHNVGGLVGSGIFTRITTSSAGSGTVNGDSYVGGLVGSGGGATITSSYAVSEVVNGSGGVGGLVGDGSSATVTSSYAVSGNVSGDSHVGGLVGFGGLATVTSSYAVSGNVSGDSHVGGLIGSGGSAAITSSYWDSSSSGITEGSYGLPKTTRELQSPTNSVDIYTNWTTRCADDSLAWNFGTSFQYPALTCTSNELPPQRSYAVTGLQAIPGDRKATLSWNNPHAQIASISISYKKNGSNDVPLRSRSTNIAPNANVQHTIGGLTNGEYYTFTVSLTLNGDSVGKEGIPPSVSVAIGPNYDGDSIVDFMDVDDDGDGLIEIATAEQFNQIRHNLLGSSFIISQGGIGNSIGCGNGKDITACNGYELVADISLAGYDNWESIGSCPTYTGSSLTCTDTSALFNGIFDGNGWTISDLTIERIERGYSNALGLFGAISPESQLRNIHIRSVSITGADTNVGMLVGYARGASITNSSVSEGFIIGKSAVGGLVGAGIDANITSSYVAGGSVSGRNWVGGLVGRGQRAIITSSYTAVDSVSGVDNVGGLVGDGSDAVITSSYAAGGPVSGRNWVGGLVGQGRRAIITLSYAAGGPVSGDNFVGGLVGYGNAAIITLSYASGGTVSGDNWVGGLVGEGGDSTITASYASGGSVIGSSRVGGLVGDGTLANIVSSYAAGGSVTGVNRVGSLVGDGSGSTITSSYASWGVVIGSTRVGGLVGDGGGASITNSLVLDGNVSGVDFVGGLVGSGGSATITNSFMSSVIVRGAGNRVGGLVGDGSGVSITSSFAENGTVSGNLSVGGLVGFGDGATITSSYVVSEAVRGDNFVGGLVGSGDGATITSSYVVSEAVRGDNFVGGLVGSGDGAIITSSYAVSNTVNGASLVGGLVGGGSFATITSSYAVSDTVNGTNSVGGLVGDGFLALITYSYWDNTSSGITEGNYGLPQTTYNLQSQTNFTDIYGNWTTMCADGSRAWNLGTSFQYPALACTSGELTTQRSRVAAGRSYAVTELQAIPGDEEVNISWNNPYAQISSISISYRKSGSNDVPLTKSITEIAPNANVQHTIDGLTNGEYYTFIVSLTLRDDFAGKEGAGTSINVAIGPNNDGDGLADFVDPDDDNDGIGDNVDIFPYNSTESEDSDNDGTGDNADPDDDNDGTDDEVDVDADGDGLIEIATAAQLNQVRYNLLGNSSKASSGGFNNISGCGNGTMEGEDITACNGYELVADISLADYDNWEPIGSCRTYAVPSSTCIYTVALFDSIFDGNGYIISDLTIANPSGIYADAAGLFGGISSYAQLHNIHIRSASITGADINVGILVGYARGASITNSSVSEGSVSGGTFVGGLVGFGGDASITLSYASSGSVSGSGPRVGGLVGDGSGANITLSYASDGSVSGTNSVGGLVGDGSGANITLSYASDGSVSGTNSVGGLVGDGNNLTITSSYAVSEVVSGTGNNVGGLVGDGRLATVSTSYAVSGTVSGASNVGGLVGLGNANTMAPNSYWKDTVTIMGTPDGGNYGSAQTTTALRTPTNAGGIYSSWTTKCSDDSLGWDFGTASQYPALTCTPGGAPAQR